MFKMFSTNNGRQILVGELKIVENIATIEGNHWNWETKENEHKKVSMTIPGYMSKKAKEFQGGKAIISYMAGRTEEEDGQMEELLLPGEAMEVKNDRGNRKLVGIMTVRAMNWNEKRSVLQASFLNVKNEKGQMLGNESEDRDGNPTHWLNCAVFPAKGNEKGNNTAERFEERVEKGDELAIAMGVKEFNGSDSYSLMKYEILGKEKRVNKEKGKEVKTEPKAEPKVEPKPEAKVEAPKEEPKPEQSIASTQVDKADLPVGLEDGYDFIPDEISEAPAFDTDEAMKALDGLDLDSLDDILNS